MLKNKVLKFGKGIRIFMNEKIRACKEVLSIAQHRLIVGLIAFGLGIGLIASVYLNVLFLERGNI